MTAAHHNISFVKFIALFIMYIIVPLFIISHNDDALKRSQFIVHKAIQVYDIILYTIICFMFVQKIFLHKICMDN